MAVLLMGCAKLIDEGDASGPVIEVDGKQIRHGIWVEEFADGTRKSHGRYTRGIKTGLHRTWHANGQPATERRYDWEGKLHEKQVDFDEAGQRTSKLFYDHGEEAVDEDDEEEAAESDGVDTNAPPDEVESTDDVTE
jgi:hypothetical protein